MYMHPKLRGIRMSIYMQLKLQDVRTSIMDIEETLEYAEREGTIPARKKLLQKYQDTNKPTADCDGELC